MRNEKQIVGYLNEVVTVLQQFGVSQPFHVLIPGGAYMIIRKKRSFTEDIDFATIQIPSPIPERGPFKVTIIPDEIARKQSGIPFAAEFRRAIEVVAQRHPNELQEDWLNDEAAQYVRRLGACYIASKRQKVESNTF